MDITQCSICGKVFVKKNHLHKYCSKCKKIVKIEQKKKYNKNKEKVKIFRKGKWISKRYYKESKKPIKQKSNENPQLTQYARKYKITIVQYKKITSKCFICGFDKTVDLHHIDLDKENNDISNFVGLCPNHHQLIHRNICDLKELLLQKMERELTLGGLK